MAEQQLILPSPEHLELLSVLSVLLLFIYLPYIGMLIGSMSFSLFFRMKDYFEPSDRTQRLGKDILTLVPSSIWLYIMLGVIPLCTLMIIYSEWFYRTYLNVSGYFTFIISTAIIGLIFTYIYQNLMKRQNFSSLFTFLIGLIGFLFLGLEYYMLISAMAIFLVPEQWTLFRVPVAVSYSWNSFAHFLVYMTVAYALTGLGILFFWFQWEKQPFDEEYKRFVRYFGGGVAFASILGLPLVIFWYLTTLPSLAFSPTVFLLYIVILLILLFVSISLYRILSKPSSEVGSKAFVMFLLTLIILLTANELAKGNVNWAHQNVIIDLAEKAKADLEDKRTAGEKVTIDLALGEQVYKNRCSTCHAFDHKVVGPPHNSVISKYLNDQETLKRFIKNPWKVDPSYPQMPPQSVNRNELESVVAYMIDHYKKEYNIGETPTVAATDTDSTAKK